MDFVWSMNQPRVILHFPFNLARSIGATYVFYLFVIPISESCPFPITSDMNITASSIYDDFHNPTYASLNSDTWWRPTGSSAEWLRVDFATRVLITAVAIQGGGETAPYWVEYFKIFYSEDGVVWFATKGNMNRELGDFYVSQIYIKLL